MERLTKILNSGTVVYTQGKYEDTVPAEMTTNDVRTVLRKLAEYENIGTIIELKQLKENGGFTSLELTEIAIALKELRTYREADSKEIDERFCKWKAGLSLMDNRGFEIECNGSPLEYAQVSNNFSFGHFKYCPFCGRKIKWNGKE